MFCNKCGGRFKDPGQRYCEYCGADVFVVGYSNTAKNQPDQTQQVQAEPQWTEPQVDPQQIQPQQWADPQQAQQWAEPQAAAASSSVAPQWTAPVQPQPTPGAWATPPTNYVNNFYGTKKEPISVGGWILRSLIPCIPFVGSLIYFIMLFVWAGDSSKEESFCNWAKAQLWIMLIFVLLVVFLLVMIFSLGISLMDY